MTASMGVNYGKQNANKPLESLFAGISVIAERRKAQTGAKKERMNVG